ncbi:cyclophilin-like fold protein [Diaminobutyricibacter sp. McL0618]|uniref:cyclophilin-like fold protein n=1 Tax=Leifsonia sp. McL0618 TaxID=3415677 RepID=UPI003CEE1DEB
MLIRLTSAAGDFEGELYSNPVALELVAQLPLELPFSDFNDVEKVARLPRALRVSGVPEKDQPAPGEIGYYAPTKGLALYYGHVGRWPGLVRIGRFDYDLQALRALDDGVVIRIGRLQRGE